MGKQASRRIPSVAGLRLPVVRPDAMGMQGGCREAVYGNLRRIIGAPPAKTCGMARGFYFAFSLSI
ncbi:MAG: hypothetical protein OXU88_06400 [Gammaproteobacteria bacterium]|nr:hypothetical protein [Gammaproteobacteria bacterium]